MSVTQTKLQIKLTELLDILSSVDLIVNGHMASFITKNLWTNALPPLVAQELENFSCLSTFVPLYFNFLVDNDSACMKSCPNLKRFLCIPRTQSVLGDTSFVTPSIQLYCKFRSLGVTSGHKVNIKDFMSEKKKHEVERMVPLTEVLSKIMRTPYVVDVGGGKGYLSATMAKHCGLRVLTLDSSSVTTSGAEKLEKKMAKAASRSAKDSHKFVRETVLVRRNTELAPIVSRSFGSNDVKFGLVGLHTCGDLATITLHHFLRENAGWVINVGCCYHLIEEEFEQDDFWEDLNCANDFGFPASSFLRRKNVKLGRNARMLAAHCLEKIMQVGISQEAAKSLYYRALFQVIVERARGHDFLEGRIGRLASKCVDFHQYVRRALQKLQLDIQLSDEDIEHLQREFADEEIKLQVFFLLRMHLAPLVESVILLDRLLFLLEEGIDNAYLVPLFDPVLSPRNHAIIAWKSASATI